MDKTEMSLVITRQRKEQGLTQKQLADALAVSNKTVSKWETGKGFPDITILPVLAEALHITVDELLGGSAFKNRECREGDTLECAEYLAAKTILRFKNACVLSCVLSVLGVLAYWILWRETHNILSLLVGLVFGLVSGCVALMEYNRLQAQIKKFNGLFPEKRKNLSEIKRYLEKTIFGWMLFVWVVVDLAIVNRYGNQYEPIRMFLEGLVYGILCICLNARFEKQIEL